MEKSIMPEQIPLPPKGAKPTARSIRRAQLGQRQDIRLPEKEYQARQDPAGQIICPTCHAISIGKRWFFDEARYQSLVRQPETKQHLCPGDERLARQMYGGEIILRSSLLANRDHRDQLSALIEHEATAAAREDNPLHRFQILEEAPDQIHLVTTTAYLASRIAKAVRDLWHADDVHPQGTVHLRLLKSRVRRSAASFNQMDWPSQ
jgi:hypothetical protein